jgi:hypothetical protein
MLHGFQGRTVLCGDGRRLKITRTLALPQSGRLRIGCCSSLDIAQLTVTWGGIRHSLLAGKRMPEVVSGLFLEILILRQHSRGYLGATTNRMAHKYRTMTLRCNMAILRRPELKELRAGRVDKLGRTNEPLASETGLGRERLDVRSDRGEVRSLVAVAATQVDPAHLPLALQSSCTLVPKKFRSKVQLVHAESTHVPSFARLGRRERLPLR